MFLIKNGRGRFVVMDIEDYEREKAEKKLLEKLQEAEIKIKEWQEHYMEKLVKEYSDYLCSEIPASTKFGELEKRIKQDKKIPEC